MADAFTTNLNINKQEVGAHNNTWGTTLNSDFDLIDAKFGARTSIASGGGATTLSATEQNVAKVKITGVLASACTINFNATGGVWVFENATTGAFALTAKVTGQTGVTVARGERCLLVYNGTDLEKVEPQTHSPIVLTDGASVAVDLSLIPDRGCFDLTAVGDRTLATPTNLVDGKLWRLLHRASGGARTLAVSAGYGFGSDIASLTATASGKVDLLAFQYDATLAKSILIAVVKGYG